MASEGIGKAFHERVVAYRQLHPGTSYGDAMRAVERAEPAAAMAYMTESRDGGAELDHEADFAAGAKRMAGIELHQRALALRQRDPRLAYGQALERAMVADSSLTRQYETGEPRRLDPPAAVRRFDTSAERASHGPAMPLRRPA